jgi:hypothetical protein
VPFMTLGGAVNAASMQDEARQFFERFVAAQNAHDLATVGSMLWNSEDFLWVTRGVQVRGSKTALNVLGSYYKGTWHLDPDTNQLQATASARCVMHRTVAEVMVTEHAATRDDHLELIGLVEVRAGDGARTLLDQEGHRAAHRRPAASRPAARCSGWRQ